MPFHSTVEAAQLGTDRLDGEYWFRNLRQTVQLDPVIRTLLEGGARSFLEISPHPVLGFGIRQTAFDLGLDDVAVLATLRRGEGGERFVRSMAEAHVGWDPDRPYLLSVPATGLADFFSRIFSVRSRPASCYLVRSCINVVIDRARAG